MLTKISNTLDQMLSDRGYDPLDQNDYTAGRLFMSRDGDNTAYVLINDKASGKVLGTEDIDNMLRTLKEHNATRGIIVGNGVSSQAGDLIATNNNSSSISRLEFFPLERMRYNPTQNILYNPHTIVTGEALEEVRAVYGDLQTLPKLVQEECPIVQYFGWNVGDVIKIERLPKKIGNYTFRRTSEIVYRLVV